MSIKSKHNIITLIAGGTGGHIYPAIAILNEIKKTNKIIFITDERGNNYILNEKDLINKSSFEIIIIDVISPFKKGLLNKFKFLYFFIININQKFKLVLVVTQPYYLVLLENYSLKLSILFMNKMQ